MDNVFKIIKTSEVAGSTFRSRFLQFGDYDLSLYSFEAVYYGFFGEIRENLSAYGNTLEVPLTPIEDKTGNVSVDLWATKNGERDLFVIFNVDISKDSLSVSDSITHIITVTFNEEVIPVEIVKAVVNNFVNYEALTEEQIAELRFDYEDFSPENIAELQEPALEAAKIAEAARGWSPLLTVNNTIIQGKSLMELTGWTGGTGEEPAVTEKYLKIGGGFTEDPEEGVDIRGRQGEIGLIIFEVNEEMDLIQHTEGEELNFAISAEGNLTLTF